MERRTLRVRLGAHGYDIAIGRGLMREAGRLAAQTVPAKRALLVTDEHVEALCSSNVMEAFGGAGYDCALCVVPAGEHSKSLARLTQVYEALCRFGVTRDDVLVALGGGVVGDLTGFAAATYLRGVRYVQLPTTLLAQVDSAVGGKTGIDLNGGKNLVGAFHQPSFVLVDPDVLTTLDERVFLDGMAEVLKYALAFDETLLALTGTSRAHAQARMDEIVYRCLDMKRGVVERDERDTGERMLLNFGHTLGHAIEAAQRYEGYTHGEAVAIGMHLMTRVSERLRLTEPGTADAIERLLIAWGLPTTCPGALWPAMREALARDKKHIGGALNAVVLTRMGEARIVGIERDVFEEVTAWLQ